MTEWGIDTLFNPGKRHLDEEKRRLQSTREEIGDSSGGKRIDLDSGVVRLPRPKAKPAESDEQSESGEQAGSDEQSESGESAESEAKSEADTSES